MRTTPELTRVIIRSLEDNKQAKKLFVLKSGVRPTQMFQSYYLLLEYERFTTNADKGSSHVDDIIYNYITSFITRKNQKSFLVYPRFVNSIIVAILKKKSRHLTPTVAAHY